MHRILLAIALASCLQGAHAAQAHAAPSPAPAAGVMQASLSLSAQDAQLQRSELAPAPAGPMAGTAVAAPEGDRDSTTPMLLAGLLLMAGIALRRWGAGQQ